MLVNTLARADALSFKDAMAMMAASVQLVATDGRAGRAGLTVTAACSVCQEPPRLLVCVNTKASAHAAILDNGRLSLNLLSNEHSEIAAAFGGRVPPEKRFELGEWTLDELGQPMLKAHARISAVQFTRCLNRERTRFLCVTFISRRATRVALLSCISIAT